MRRSYISPEFSYTGQYGTMNMAEETSFFGSKMLYVPNTLSVTNENIVYYQMGTGEQVNFSLEKSTQPIVYSSILDKKDNHKLTLDTSQSDSQKNSNAKWIVQIDLNTILTDYIFANIKQNRTFNGVLNSMTSYNNVNSAINNYITTNVLNRYQFSNIDFYIQYESFIQNGTLRFNNSFTEINNSTYLINQLQYSLDPSKTTLTINFNQAQSSASYNFNYYFNLYFERI